jgi:hypothetical protein
MEEAGESADKLASVASTFSQMDIKHASARKRLVDAVSKAKKKGYNMVHDGFHVRACSVHPFALLLIRFRSKAPSTPTTR